MNPIEHEILALEEQLRRAELGPDPEFFARHIDDKMVFAANGQAACPNDKIVEAHRPGKGQKFTRVEMSDMKVVEHSSTAVVTCQGTYAGPGGTHILKYMRVWVKKPDG